MGLPFVPESDAEISARYPDAIRELNDGTWNPGQYRRHVMDFRNGLRLIISREDLRACSERLRDIPELPDDELDTPQIHVSASIQTGFPLFQRVVGKPLANRRNWFFTYVPKICRGLFGLKELRLVYTSEAEVPHYLQRCR